MTTSTYKPSTRFVFRLGMHHFAHVRALALGLDVVDSAVRYLGIEHGNQARAASRQTVDAVRAIATRRGEGAAWRLIGLTITVKPDASKPTLETFIEERGLDDWSESDAAQMYEEAYPADPKAEKRQRLQERLLELLRRLETQVAEQPLPEDMVSGWFDDVTAKKLISAGMLTLSDLRVKISVGGRWYSALPAVGEAKAERIKAHLANLLPMLPAPPLPCFALPGTPRPASAATEPTPLTPTSTLLVAASTLPSEAVDQVDLNLLPFAITAPKPMLEAKTDLDAAKAWITAKVGLTGSHITAKTYLREVTRLMLWLERERAGKKFADMRIEDCVAYMLFLQDLPAHWISRISAAPGEPGWAPFRGPLSLKSLRQTIVIVASMFKWLHEVQYLHGNPWAQVNKKTGDDPEHSVLDTKALSETASSEIIDFIDRQPPSPARARIRFITIFMTTVGLRSKEFLDAKLSKISMQPEGWVMKVHGKGAKNRVVTLPAQAMAALQDYLAERGLGGIETAPAETYLLGNLNEPSQPLGYQSFYEHVTNWFKKAIKASNLTEYEQNKLYGVSPHWLRHTFATLAIARGVPVDVVQPQLGHADSKTTTALYGRAPLQRRMDEMAKAFS
jgi:site-specific recombinase XerD